MVYAGAPIARPNINRFIPNVWADEVRHYRDKKFVMSELVKTRNFVGQKGDTMYQPLVGRAAVFPRIAGQPVNFQMHEPDEYRLKIDQDNESSFAVDDLVKVQSQYDVRRAFSKEHGYALRRDLDNAVLALRAAVPAANQIFVSSTDTAAGNPEAISRDAIIAAKTFLDERDVPEDSRVMAVSPSQYNQLLVIPEFVSQDFITGRPTTSGIIGRLYDITVIMTTQITYNTLTGYYNGEGAPGQPTPGVEGSPYLPTQDTIVGTGLPRGKTGNEVAQPFQTAIVCNREWAILAKQVNLNVEYGRLFQYKMDGVIYNQVYGAKLYRKEDVVLIHTA